MSMWAAAVLRKKTLKECGMGRSGAQCPLHYLCVPRFPAQGFNTISAVGAIAGVFTGTVIETNSALYWISFAVLIAATAVISFGGIKKVTKVTDLLVPVMAVIYILTVILLIVFNIPRIPWFFGAVFSEAFRPEAVFGGALRYRAEPGNQERPYVK